MCLIEGRRANDVGSSAQSRLLHALPDILKIADDGLFFCLGETMVKAARVSVTSECCPCRLLLKLTRHPHRLVVHRLIGATASRKYEQND